MLFLDLETTGLSGGTGTIAFLVGLARFVDGALSVEQLIVPDLGAEAPVLARVAERVREASCLVTFNGKTFDWPLLRTRFVMNRMPMPPLAAHVDLLHVGRRIWKPRLGSVRLTEIERDVLRFEREGDVDGSEIPGRYFGFLRDGRAARLLPVLEHNQHDLVALAGMLGVLGRHMRGGAQAARELHAVDALSFARVSARAKDSDRALSFARHAEESVHSDALSCAALTLTADVHKRAGDPKSAVLALEQALLLASREIEAHALHLALSKLYERELRDLARAHFHARFTDLVEGPEAQGRRLGRLRKRLDRTSREAP